MKKEEIYVAVDVETDGLFPGMNSMLSVGAAAFKRGNCLPSATFARNLFPVQRAKANPNTLEFWKEHPEEWKVLLLNRVPAPQAMREFALWLESLPGRPVYVAYPAAFDFSFTHYYFLRFLANDPFGHGAVDLMTAIWTKLDCPNGFRSLRIGDLSAQLLEGTPEESHIAVQDAIRQGIIFAHAMGWKNRPKTAAHDITPKRKSA